MEHPSEAAAVKKFRTAERIARIAKVQAQAAARAERKKLKSIERLKRRAEKLRKLLERKAKSAAVPEQSRIVMPSGPRIIRSGYAQVVKGE
jgi:prephenate dehydrogenase